MLKKLNFGAKNQQKLHLFANETFLLVFKHSDVNTKISSIENHYIIIFSRKNQTWKVTKNRPKMDLKQTQNGPKLNILDQK